MPMVRKTGTENHRRKMESIYGAGFWSVCHGYNVYVDVKVLLAELKGTGTYFAIKALKKDVVLEDNDTECTMLERRVLELGSKCHYITYLHSSFQSPVSCGVTQF